MHRSALLVWKSSLTMSPNSLNHLWPPRAQIVNNAIVLGPLLKLVVVLLDTGKVTDASVAGFQMVYVINRLAADSRVLIRELAADILNNKLPNESRT